MANSFKDFFIKYSFVALPGEIWRMQKGTGLQNIIKGGEFDPMRKPGRPVLIIRDAGPEHVEIVPGSTRNPHLITARTFYLKEYPFLDAPTTFICDQNQPLEKKYLGERIGKIAQEDLEEILQILELFS
jgi:mRNA-degrading endonuclease toxin of MazEF toxin-antitoxin module